MDKNEIRKIIDESGKKTEVHYEGKDKRTTFDENAGEKMELLQFSNVENNSEDIIKDNWSVFFDFKRKYDQHYGTIKIERNLISISTGGWSDNEDLLEEFKKTWFYRLYFSHMSTGGHYYLDTDKNNKESKHWRIIKE